jgi:four helix bundle protein
MSEKELKDRTKQFALRVMKLVNALPDSIAGHAIASQLVRTGTSVGANYRAACRICSKAEFSSKMETVVEETEECCFWLELIMDGELLPRNRVEPLHHEANELTEMFVSSIRPAKNSLANRKSKTEP